MPLNSITDTQQIHARLDDAIRLVIFGGTTAGSNGTSLGNAKTALYLYPHIT